MCCIPNLRRGRRRHSRGFRFTANAKTTTRHVRLYVYCGRESRIVFIAYFCMFRRYPTGFETYDCERYFEIMVDREEKKPEIDQYVFCHTIGMLYSIDYF